MSQFEFFQVLASVVVALGVAEIASGWGRQLRAGPNVKSDWLQLGWTVTILFNAAMYWMGMWPYSGIDFEYLGQVYFLVIPSVFYVLLCFSITPTLPAEEEFSVRDYYMEKRKPIFIAYCAFIVTSFAADVAISRTGSLSDLLPLAALLAALAVLAFSTRVALHATVMGLLLAVFIGLGFGSLDGLYQRFEPPPAAVEKSVSSPEGRGG